MSEIAKALVLESHREWIKENLCIKSESRDVDHLREIWDFEIAVLGLENQVGAACGKYLPILSGL